MSTGTLFRLSGLLLLVAVPLQVIGWVLHPPGEEIDHVLQATYRPSHIVLLVSWLCVLLGLPGLYARQAHRAGKLGLVGFGLVMIMVAYHCYLLTYEAFATTILASDPATSALVGEGGKLSHGVEMLGGIAMTLVLAYPLFGIATVRAGILPRWTGWLFVASVPLLFLAFIAIPASIQEDLPGWALPIALHYYLLYAGFALAGYALWVGNERAASVGAGGTELSPTIRSTA